MAIVPGLEGINWGLYLSQFMYYVWWGMMSLLLLIVMLVVFIFVTFNIKATVFPLYGSGKDGIFSVQRKRWNRLRWNKAKTAWRPLLPLFNKKEVEPFDSEYIYPGNQIYAFDLNGNWTPGRINVDKDEEEMRSEISPVPYFIRNWQSLEHKKNAVEYSQHTFWDDNKTLVVALICSIALLASALIFIYFTYKFAAGGRADIGALTEAINRFSNIPGQAPR